MKIYGFAILKNEFKDNTCFRESISSLVDFCHETHVFIEKSVDGTKSGLSEIEGLVIHTEEVSDILQELREGCVDIPGAWGLFLNPDEVLHANDKNLLVEDIDRARELNCEAISFRNLNFVNDPHKISICSEFNPHSIRLFRLGSNDYFQNEEVELDDKVFYSEVKLFNYGLLREEKEVKEIAHSKSNLLSFLGPHPICMKRRVENWGGVWDRLEVAKVYILGEPRDFRTEFVHKIKAKKVIWVGHIVDIPAEDRPKAIIMTPNIFQKLFRSSGVPTKAKAKNAHVWSEEFILSLKLFEKGVAVD